MSEIRVTSVVGENGGDRVGLTTGLTVGRLTGTTGIGATITHHGHAQFAGICTATSFVGGGLGITEFDHWYLSSSYIDTNNANITNWSRFTQSNVSAASPLGTGMSHSSGTFSFPSTGKYLVILNAVLLLVQNDNVLIDTRVTIDNSNYYSHTSAREGNSASNTIAGSGVSFAFIDVTNTSNVKVQFYAKSINSGSQVLGYDASHGMGTSALFIRLGDT